MNAAVRASFIGTLPDRMVDALLRDALLHHIAAGRVFIDENDPGWVGVMVSGLARVYLDPPDGPQVTVRHVRTGASVGVASLARERHPVSARAVTACRVLQLDSDRVLGLAEREPAAAIAIARELAARLLDTYGELAIRAHGSVRQRLARHLLDSIDDEADSLPDGSPLIVFRTHEQLAEAIGSAREVVSKVCLISPRKVSSTPTVVG